MVNTKLAHKIYMDAIIQEVKDENEKTKRIADYSDSDVLLQIYINRVLLFIYAVLYLLLLLSLYIHREETPYVIIIIVALFFLAYPFFIDFVGTNITSMFVKLKNMFYTGNALIMYKPADKATY